MLSIYNDILNLLKLPHIKLSLLLTTIATIGTLVFELGTFIGKSLYYLGF